MPSDFSLLLLTAESDQMAAALDQLLQMAALRAYSILNLEQRERIVKAYFAIGSAAAALNEVLASA